MIRVDSRSFAVKAILVAALPRWVISGLELALIPKAGGHNPCYPQCYP
jgi:hypothetical protein